MESPRPTPIRLDPALRAAADREIARRKRLIPAYSLNALVQEALAHYLQHLAQQRKASE